MFIVCPGYRQFSVCTAATFLLRGHAKVSVALQEIPCDNVPDEVGYIWHTMASNIGE